VTSPSQCRIRRPKPSLRTCAGSRRTLAELRAEIETGVTSSVRYTVTETVRKWLDVGLKGRAPKTIEKCRTLIDNQIVPQIGAASCAI